MRIREAILGGSLLLAGCNNPCKLAEAHLQDADQQFQEDSEVEAGCPTVNFYFDRAVDHAGACQDQALWERITEFRQFLYKNGCL